MHSSTKRSTRTSTSKRPVSDNDSMESHSTKRVRGDDEVDEPSAPNIEIDDGNATDLRPVPSSAAAQASRQEDMSLPRTKELDIGTADSDSIKDNSVVTSTESSGTQDDVDVIQSHCGARWPRDIRRRLPAIVESKDINASRFNIANSPPVGLTQWSKLTRDNAEQYLTLKTKPKDAMRFWAVGEIPSHGTYLVGENGAPFGSISLKVVPVREGEYEKWSSLLDHLGGWKGHSSDDDDKVLSASQWMTFREKGETTSKVRHFQHCYDATNTLRRYKDMTMWPIEKIGANDLVIMEVRIRRWKCDSMGKSRYTKEWEPYRVSLELSAISMLAVGPDKQRDDDLSNAVEEEFTL